MTCSAACFALSQQQPDKAYQYMQQMEARGIQLGPYLDAAMIQDIHRAVGVQSGGEGGGSGLGGSGVGVRYDDDVGEEIDEDVGEDVEEEF